MRATALAWAVISVSSLWSVSAARAGDGGGLMLVEEKPDPDAIHGDQLFKSGVKALRAGKPERAMILFERALPFKSQSSDLYYNLVQVAKTLHAWDKVALYAQGFLFREPGTRDALVMRDDLDHAFAELAKDGRVPVVYKFDVSPLETPVLVNGIPMTSNPAVEIRLLPGKYTVSAAKEDWNPWTQPLVVQAGAAPTTVTGALTAIPAVGEVIIDTTPGDGVEVYRDDVLIGTTPIAKSIELSTGKRYLFRFEKAGFDRWVRYIEVYKGEKLKLAPVMEEVTKTTKREDGPKSRW